MVQRLRNRAQGQEGFTLIELLVVVLIIGILAAVAIPVFLNQTGKANAANAKSDINSAATAEETYYTDNQLYIAAAGTNAGATALTTINSALTNPFGSANEALSVASAPTTGTGALAADTISNSYIITAADPAQGATSGVTYTYMKNASGIVTRACTMTSGVNPGGCKLTAGSTTAGTW